MFDCFCKRLMSFWILVLFLNAFETCYSVRFRFLHRMWWNQNYICTRLCHTLTLFYQFNWQNVTENVARKQKLFESFTLFFYFSLIFLPFGQLRFKFKFFFVVVFLKTVFGARFLFFGWFIYSSSAAAATATSFYVVLLLVLLSFVIAAPQCSCCVLLPKKKREWYIVRYFCVCACVYIVCFIHEESESAFAQPPTYRTCLQGNTVLSPFPSTQRKNVA